MSTSGGVWKALERGVSIGCEIVQLFVKNNMQWFGKPYSPDDVAHYANELASSKFAAIFGHTGYLINLAAPPSKNRDESIKSLIQEIQLATDLRLPFLVMHPGAHLGRANRGIKQVVTGLNEVFAPQKFRGQDRVGSYGRTRNLPRLRIAHLASIYDGVDQPARLGVCLDTAHLFAAGYHVHTLKGWNKTIKKRTLVGLKRFWLSPERFKDRVWLARGPARRRQPRKIGREAFGHIVNDPRFQGCRLPGDTQIAGLA
jgi:deoxyribonuclease-4